MTPALDEDPDKLKEELRKSKQNYHVLFEETNDAVFLIDLQGIYFKVNDSAANMLGFAVEELVNLSYRDIIHDTELANAEHNLE